jgi:polyribonucleotide nucleotidyltransferase
MFNIITQELDFAGKKITLEYGHFARQADSAVMVSYGKTKILCTVVFQKGLEVVNNFFPLTVAYMERYHAVGKIPGGFIKRETKPSEKEILTSRLIDRTIRPMFDESFLNEVQVACTVFSYDGESNLDFLSLLGAVSALRTTEIPFYETVAGVQVGFVNDKLILNCSKESLRKSSLDMFLSSTKNSILMVEVMANELSEEKLLEAMDFAMQKNAEIINFIDEFAGKVNGLKAIEPIELKKVDNIELANSINSEFNTKIADAFKITNKKERKADLELISNEIKDKFLKTDFEPSEEKRIEKIITSIEKSIVRKQVVYSNLRIDGRNNEQIRPIKAELSVLPNNVHGSALFTRGETQALISVTVGSEKDAQMIDTMADGVIFDRFSVHYNFPGFSVGEVARFGPPGRREIGHGNLAKKALIPMLPDEEDYPFAIRAVSDILESNGSSSMATVCGVSLGLLTAGVPMKKLVSGIAMGLIKEGDDFTVLSDILGDEDHLGDMDFKVAGTEDGVTALQMDIKIRGITIEIVRKALEQAKSGRSHIMSKMKEGIDVAPKSEPKATPQVKTITVPESAVRLLIGPGGSVIKDLCARSEATIDIAKQGGVIKISAMEKESVDLAVKLIDSIVNPPKEEYPPLFKNEIHSGIVKRILDGFIVVKLNNGAVGNVYGYDISYSRFDKIEDVFMVGEQVKVKVIAVNENFEAKLSLKLVDQETGKDLSALYKKEVN